MQPELSKTAIARMKKYQEAKKTYYHNHKHEMGEIFSYFGTDNIKSYLAIVRDFPVWELPIDGWLDCLLDYQMVYDNKSKRFLHYMGYYQKTPADYGDDPDKKREESKQSRPVVFLSYATVHSALHKAMKVYMNNKLDVIAQRFQMPFDNILDYVFTFDSYDSFAWQFIYKKQVDLDVRGKKFTLVNDFDIGKLTEIQLYCRENNIKPDMFNPEAENITDVYKRAKEQGRKIAVL